MLSIKRVQAYLTFAVYTMALLHAKQHTPGDVGNELHKSDCRRIGFRRAALPARLDKGLERSLAR